MRLLDIHIKNYRAHRDLAVKFSQTVQVIGGRNESGKSTLAEAIHRVLFLKSEGSTEVHKLMKSDFGGEPEIRLRFEQGGRNYVLFKRFLKNQVTQFGEENQRTFTDDEAEEELSKVIRAKTGLGKSGLASQWAHLWVWQDKSMGNPLEKDLYPHQDLLSEMHRLGGGAAVMQSAKDQQLAKLFMGKRDELFTTKGLQASCAAAKARERANDLSKEVAEAKAILQEIQEALEQIRVAEETIEQRGLLDAEVTEQLRIHNEDLAKVEVLEKKVDLLAGPLKEATDSIEQLEGDKTRITALEKDATSLRAALDKAEDKLKPLAKRLAEARDEVAAATDTAKETYERRDELQAKVTLNQQSLDRIELLKQQATLKNQLEKAESLDTEIAKLSKELAGIPDIDKKTITQLKKLSEAVDSAKTTLEAMGLSILVKKAGKKVSINDADLAAGASLNIVESTNIKVGDDVVLVVAPKNGDIAEQRKQLDEATQKMAKAFREHGIETLAEAETHQERRRVVESAITAKEEKRGEQSAEDLRNELQELDHSLTQHDAKHPDAKSADLKDDKTLATEKTRLAPLLRKAIAEAEANGKLMVDAQKRVTDAEALERDAATDVTRHREDLTRSDSKKDGMLEKHGDMAGLDRAIATARSKFEGCAKQHQEASAELAKLAPDQVRAAIRMKTTALEKSAGILSDAERISATNRGVVSTRSKGDPKAALESAVARHEVATAEFERENRLAEALKLLGDTFEQTQAELNQAFTGPLVEKINEYAKVLFGHDAKIEMTPEEGGFTEPLLIRPQKGQASNTTFDKLSGGAKEQLAASIRLAMAEVLSGPYGGHLPVLLDDTFSYTDTENLNKVHLLLNHAAEKGIQVILLTHSPQLFKAMGADEFILPSK